MLKRYLKPKNKKQRKTKKIFLFLCCALLVSSSEVAIFNFVPTFADSYDDKIKQLENQNSSYQSQIGNLQKQADTLSNKLSELSAQISSLQVQINISQAKYDKLQNEISVNEEKLTKERDALGKTIADLYVDGDVTTIEMIASSKSIGDFLDKQEYQSSIRNSLTSTIKEIKKIKLELNDQKNQVSLVLKQQNVEKSGLTSIQQQQQSILNETQNQESAYQNIVQSNNTKVAALKKDQAAANAAAAKKYDINVTSGDASHGGYPAYLDNAVQDSLTDPWGMDNRECVSYAAWRVYNAYGSMPYWGGRGNANQWPSDAEAAGIKVDSSPTPGSVAIMMSGAYGHAAWVESVSGGSVHVSQYNYYEDGRYTEMTVSSSFFNYYIHFGK